MKNILDTRPPFVKNLLLVGGFSRGGKLLLANIINGFERVEPVQYHWYLEYLPFLEKFGLIDKKTAQELIRCGIDIHSYEMLIGRNLNHRIYDGSTIFKVPRYKEYLKRSKKKDTDAILKKFRRDNPYSFFMVHELMPNIKIYFDIFPHLKMIDIKRNPVDIVYAWYKRGLLRRLGKDPKIFMVLLKGKHGPMPWYAYGFKESYHLLSEVEKTILSIKTLFEMYKKSYTALPERFKKRILSVSFENLVFNNTNEVIENIGTFLNRNTLPELKSILKREDVPRNAAHGKWCGKSEERFKCTDCKLEELKMLASVKYINMLTKLKNEYEAGQTY